MQSSQVGCSYINNTEEGADVGGASDGESPTSECSPVLTRRMSRLANRVNQQSHYSSMEEMHNLTVKDVNIRRKLRFFAMNPVEKWKIRKQIPYKLCIQSLKLVLITLQIVLYGTSRTGHIKYLDETSTVFKHVFLDKWDATRDISVYPPPSAAFAIYSIPQFYHQIAFAINQYYMANDTLFTPIDYSYVNNSDEIPPISLCIERYKIARVSPFENNYNYDTHHIINCTNINLTSSEINHLKNTNFTNGSDVTLIEKYLHAREFHLKPPEGVIRANLSFALRTIHLSRSEPNDRPECFKQRIDILFDNSKQSGLVLVDLDVDVTVYSDCKGKISYSSSKLSNTLRWCLDAVVILLCLSSLILCIRALYRGQKLKWELDAYFQSLGEPGLDFSERNQLLNLWFVLICIDDILILLGTVFKISVEIQSNICIKKLSVQWSYQSNLFTSTGILLGVGNLIVWVGILRYVGFFSPYNVLILTMKRSLPHIMRFMLCAALLYAGFLFCGWLVFSPYSLKFQDLTHTSSCLFSIINGDDMFATFYTTGEDMPAVHWFARIYLYVFVCIFTYVVLSLFIAIIMDAYEVIKMQYSTVDHRSRLDRMVVECRDTPNIDNFPPSPGVAPRVRILVDRLASVVRPSGYGSIN